MTPPGPPFARLALIGIGLIGSSLALGVRRWGLADHIAIADSDPAALDQADTLALGDSYHREALEAVADADLVILCTPVGTLEPLARRIEPALAPGAILSDVGSVKANVARLAADFRTDIHLIPGHPVAGTEHSGPGAGFATLFQGRWCILTPCDGVDPTALAALTRFWEALGSQVECMHAAHHDRVLAITSHVPHLLAYNIVGTAADLEQVTRSEVIKYSAGGFRDFTRIAASDPTMWRDVFLSNKEAVLEILGRVSEDLAVLQKAIRWDDGETLHALFTRTRDIRRNVLTAGQDSPEAARRRLEGAPPRRRDG